MISEKVFLAFDTGRGLAHVQVSGWQRAYLLWTFRNFRGVPHKILNERQRGLIETLYRAASTGSAGSIDETSLIGTVEDFNGSLGSQVHFDAMSEKPLPSLAEKTLSRSQFAYSDFARLAGTLAIVAVMSRLGWQQVRNRPVVSASTSRLIVAAPTEQARAVTEPTKISKQVQPAAQATANIAVDPLPLVQVSSTNPPTTTQLPLTVTPHAAEKQNTEKQSAEIQPTGPAETSLLASKLPSSSITASPRRVIPVSANEVDASTQARVQISRPPRKIIYPDSPDRSARGKVSLQAVVGYDGKVSQIKVLAGNRLLAAAAARAIRQWRYQPFSTAAQKVERETRITVSFLSTDVVAVSFPDPGTVAP